MTPQETEKIKLMQLFKQGKIESVKKKFKISEAQMKQIQELAKTL